MTEELRNKFIIGLGSNCNREINMQEAVARLTDYFEKIQFSSLQLTKADGCPLGTADFLNRLGFGYTSYDYETVNSFCKQIEKELGRTPEDKVRCTIPIDIDILKWNENILKPADMEKEYIRNGLKLG